jgi:pyruvate kinase
MMTQPISLLKPHLNPSQKAALKIYKGPHQSLTSLTQLNQVYFGTALPSKRQVGIIATLGPKTDSPEMIRQLIDAGVDIFRLNFSHGTQEDHAKRIQWIQEARQELQKAGKLTRPIRILADVQGPKIRVGKFENGDSIQLVPGETVYLSRKATSADPTTIPVTLPQIIDALSQDQRILLDDGKLELKVTRPKQHQWDRVTCQVVRGGTLKNNKGINLPNVPLVVPALSDKDKSDLAFALAHGVDTVAISFVRSDIDMKQAREYIKGLGHKPFLIAKIEKPEAVEDKMLRRIVKQSDGVMVARGDLGVEMDVVYIPRLQEKIILEAKAQLKKVIVATQMLESMLTNNMPSRADVSDMADAVKDRADYLMLSGETAVGEYPVEAVQVMNRVIREYQPERATRARVRRAASMGYSSLRKFGNRLMGWAKRQVGKKNEGK